jgi:UDP-GlcNAc:undecaprenyl-phosphate GlcNAc-1-phosphate transferase
MSPYLFGLVSASLIAAALTPLLRRLGPAAVRSRSGSGGHLAEEPRVGGLVIFVAFALSPWLVALVSPTAAHLVLPKTRELIGLLAAAFLVFAIGYADDRRELSWFIRAAVQILAGVLLYLFGYRFGEISLPWGGVWVLGRLDPAVTVLWLVLITNAFNWIDGRDGVAAGVAIFAAAGMALVAYDLQHLLIALLFAALAGATLGFLPFNFPSASHFLGDSGAYLLGFLLAALSISGFVDQTGRIPLTIPIVALGLPILDMFVAVCRRALTGQMPFTADTDHLHDRVERVLGAGPRTLVLSFYAIALLLAAAAAAMHFLRSTAWLLAICLALVLLALAILGRLGYFESDRHRAKRSEDDFLPGGP